jgi:hypothetical protein
MAPGWKKLVPPTTEVSWSRVSSSFLHHASYQNGIHHGIEGFFATPNGSYLDTTMVLSAPSLKVSAFAQRGNTEPANCGKELSNVRVPFHMICTPMQTSRNEESLTITFIPAGPMATARRSAKA